MHIPEMFSDHRMFMFFYALMEVVASVTNVICIAQITCLTETDKPVALEFPTKLEFRNVDF